MRDVIIGGSSVTTDHPWPTWASWLKRRYNDNFIDTSVKGLGNEAIILRAFAQARHLHNPLLIIQLTNVDKWDWYVQDLDLIMQLDKEKHQVTKLQSEDLSGFWSTGSHFPRWKAHYREHYFSLDYHMWHTLLLINWLQMTCTHKQWDLHIVFDSPILAVTEQQLNQGQLDIEECCSRQLTDTPLCNLICDLIDWTNIYCPGLMGYAVQNHLPWFNEKIKGHPGSLVHWLFTQEVLLPVLDNLLIPCHDLDQFSTEAQRMQELFHAI
jgi:hypothetical protein